MRENDIFMHDNKNLPRKIPAMISLPQKLRLITICVIVKAWLFLGSRIWPKYDGTRRKRPMRACV